MNTRADRGGTVLELKVEKLGKHETAWRKRRDVQTLAISNLFPPLLFFLFSIDIGSFLMKPFSCFVNKKERKKKGNRGWDFYLATNSHANITLQKLLDAITVKEEYYDYFVCLFFFFSENVSFNETRAPISLILLFEFVSVFNSTNPLSFLGSSQLVKQYPRIRFYVISPAIKKKCTRSRQIKQSLSIINFFVSFLRSKNRYLLYYKFFGLKDPELYISRK